MINHLSISNHLTNNLSIRWCTVTFSYFTRNAAATINSLDKNAIMNCFRALTHLGFRFLVQVLFPIRSTLVNSQYTRRNYLSAQKDRMNRYSGLW
jgi:hypothetical protein